MGLLILSIFMGFLAGCFTAWFIVSRSTSTFGTVFIVRESELDEEETLYLKIDKTGFNQLKVAKFAKFKIVNKTTNL